MSSEKLLNPDELAIIEFVRHNPSIYDVRHAQFKCSKEKNLKWQYFAAQIGKSSEDCKKKWKGMRDYYYKCMQGKRNAGRKAHEMCLKLSFLKKAGPAKREPAADDDDTCTAIEFEEFAVDDEQMTQHKQQKEEEEESTAAAAAGATELLKIEIIDDANSARTIMQDNDVTAYAHDDNNSLLINSIKEMHQQQQQHFAQTQQTLLTIQNNNNNDNLGNKQNSNNQMDAFFHSMAVMANALPRRLQYQAMREITNIMTNLADEADAIVGN